MMMKKIIAIVRADVWQTPVNSSMVSRRLPSASNIVPNAPTAPASLGAAIPNRIEPLIIKISNTGGRKLLNIIAGYLFLGTYNSSGGRLGATLGLK